MLVRKALLHDASNIYDLVNSLSGDGTLLKRPFAEICENIRDFTVAESDGGVFLGCGALHLYGPHLCEVRSIVVKPEAKSQGAGGRILKALIEEAETHGIQSVCLFTRIPDFFFKYGFRTVEDKVGAARQDLQGLPDVSAAAPLRRSRHGARAHSAHVDPRPARRSAGAGAAFRLIRSVPELLRPPRPARSSGRHRRGSPAVLKHLKSLGLEASRSRRARRRLCMQPPESATLLECLWRSRPELPREQTQQQRRHENARQCAAWLRRCADRRGVRATLERRRCARARACSNLPPSSSNA